MARTVITKTVPTRSGVAITTLTTVDATAAPNGMSYATTGREQIIVKNADSVSHTMTVAIPVTVDGQVVPGKTVTIAAGATVVAGPFGAHYRQVDGSVYLNFDAATSMTVGVLDIPSV